MPDPTGYYAALADLQAVAGSTNLVTYSALDGGSTQDDARVQTALDQTDAEINLYLLSNGCASPAATSEAAFALLTQASARLAVRWLYMARGNRDVPMDGPQEESPYYAKLGGWKKEAYGFLSRYVMGKRQSIEDSFLTA